jgi:hypothetical protein
MPPNTRRLTVRQLEQLQPGERAAEPSLPGFFAEAGAKGVSLKVQVEYRPGKRGADSRARKLVKRTLGRWPEISLEDARNQARALIAEVKEGRDPRVGTSNAAAWTVGRMRDEYLRDLDIRERSERTANDLRGLFRRYLEDWLPLAASEITKDMVRERHTRISVDNGKYAANHAMRALRTCFNFTIKKTNAGLVGNPCDAVTFHRERPRAGRPDFNLPPVPGWLAKVRALKAPLRRSMHELQLFTGLRPGNIVAIERAWLRLDVSALVIPAHRMKGRITFACPLSAHAIALVRQALAAGDVLEPGSPYLFPTRGTDGTVKATTVWKEKKIAETGHLVRHMYSNAARLAGVDDVDRELLLAHVIPGVRGVYLATPSLFARLLAAQERVTTYLLAQIEPAPQKEVPPFGA